MKSKRQIVTLASGRKLMRRTIYINPELIARLEQLKRQHGKSVSFIVEHLIRTGLEAEIKLIMTLK